MRERSSKKQTPKDVNVLATHIVREATSDSSIDVPRTKEGKNAYAVGLGSPGGLKGGRARTDKLTSERRLEIAKKAAQARWGKGG